MPLVYVKEDPDLNIHATAMPPQFLLPTQIIESKDLDVDHGSIDLDMAVKNGLKLIPSLIFLSENEPTCFLIQIPPHFPSLKSSSPSSSTTTSSLPTRPPPAESDDTNMTGKIGELVFRASGKIQMKIGNIFFDVTTSWGFF